MIQYLTTRSLYDSREEKPVGDEKDIARHALMNRLYSHLQNNFDEYFFVAQTNICGDNNEILSRYVLRVREGAVQKIKDFIEWKE